MKKENANKNLYKCADLCLAGVLTLWFPVVNLDNTIPQKVLFCFEDSSELRNILKMFWSDNLQVEPKSYFQSIKLLKSRIYQE
ncbi:hypothetical protein GYA37_00085 [candidate division WWE3 bacterium]|uniref:DUF5659 domain-containing protein n=1 Tax=candidate division WWE3 bacterium TaxID=2053526 RepID=A0A7X9HS30_UNCKA|nr:hypothetical protein [candidate division WWE3 bacterium]